MRPSNDRGCPDNSGVVKDLENNSSCGSQYIYRKNYYDQKEINQVDVDWFECRNNSKCVHKNTHCDMHPNPVCVYLNDDGERVAEDEEGCLEEYKKKSLVARSANFMCPSLLHNKDSSPVKATIWNQTHYDATRDFRGSYTPNVTVIPHGTTVYIMSTRCDGVPECWNNIDEEGCGFNTSQTILFGKNTLKII